MFHNDLQKQAHDRQINRMNNMVKFDTINKINFTFNI